MIKRIYSIKVLIDGRAVIDEAVYRAVSAVRLMSRKFLIALKIRLQIVFCVIPREVYILHLDLIDQLDIRLVRKPDIKTLVEVNLCLTVNKLLKQIGMPAFWCG